MPAIYQIASPAPDLANLIVRVAHCQSVRLAGHETGEGTVAQIGVNIVAPDGTGDINNYTLYYDTTGKELAKALRRAGIRAEYDGALSYDRDDHPDGVSARLEICNRRIPGPPFSFANEVLIPTAATPAFTFTANWWQTNGKSTIEMASIFPAILFGPTSANVTLRAPAGSALARILNATTGTFAGLSVANDFEVGHMHVGPATP